MVCLWYTIFTIELASTCINQVHFPHTMDILAQSYELKGMVAVLNTLTSYIKLDAVMISKPTEWEEITCISLQSSFRKIQIFKFAYIAFTLFYSLIITTSSFIYQKC